MKAHLMIAAALVLGAESASADILWTGTTGPGIFQESNWDLSGSTVTVLDPNVPIADNVVFSGVAQEARIPDLSGGQLRFEVDEGWTMTVEGMRVFSAADDGVGSVPGATTGITIEVKGGGLFEPFFITNQVALRIDGTSRVVLGGGGNPINGSTVDMTYGASLEFRLEDPGEFTAEHLFKVTVDGLPAVLGVNLDVVSDGGLGSIVTVIPQSVGTRYCTAANNSTLVPAAMSGSGSPAAAANALVVECRDMPRFVFGFFIVSQDQGFVAMPSGSDGNLCLGGAIGRYVAPGQITNSGQAGSIALAIDLTSIPQPNGFVAASAGETWNFQAWFRDAGQGGGVSSNFSDGLSVLLQ